MDTFIQAMKTPLVFVTVCALVVAIVYLYHNRKTEGMDVQVTDVVQEKLSQEINAEMNTNPMVQVGTPAVQNIEAQPKNRRLRAGGAIAMGVTNRAQ
jgi:hypothetical protein